MNNRIRMLLLKILSENGNIANIEKAGYQYALIASEYSKLINEELIIPNEDLQFVLSDKGNMELERLKLEINKGGNWKIDSFERCKIDKMNKYDIFIE